MMLCPSDERLAQLLEEQLDRRELTDIERHLERCDHCQETLEELTRERYSFVEWQPVTESISAIHGVDRPRISKVGSHPSTIASVFDAEPVVEVTPEVEGYEILERIGHGGMGVVYRAWQHGLERLVALKMIRGGSHAAPEHLARFRIEARAVARLKHPNVVQIYDVGHAKGLPFVALELLEGGSLEAKIAATPQPERPSAELVVILAGAIAAAHRAGVVHRDLKSANVLYATDGTPKIADFGLAKRLDEEDGQTHSGQVMGSPSFMAPEQARGIGREIGPAADLYSLGAILYELLTGRPPFKGSSAMETLFQVVHDEPVPPTKLRPGLSTDLETICLKCLNKDPRRRYDSAESLANDLQRFLAGTPILARRTSLRERAWKWARRQPATATLVVLALGSTVGLTALGLHARQVEQAEEQNAVRLRLEGVAVKTEGENALRTKDWESGLKKLNDFRPKIDSNRLSDLRDDVNLLIARIEKDRAEQKKLEELQEHLKAFREFRHQAQLRDTQFLGIGDYGDVKAIREVARKALDQFKTGDSRVDSGLNPLPAGLSPAEKAEVQLGSYELLLIWAEAVSRPTDGEDSRKQTDEALNLLDRAARLHAPTRAYHLLRAGCLARKGDQQGAEAERAIAESIPTHDAFSLVLKGQGLYRNQKWVAAINEFEKALQIEPGMFRAQLLMAVCQLQTDRPDQAKTSLTACIQRQPNAISLYLLRGFAYSEEGHQRMREVPKAGPKLKALIEKEANDQFELAEADFQKILGLEPNSSERYGLLVNRGALRLRRRYLDDAIKDFNDAIKLKPDQVAAYIPLGQAYRQQGRVGSAVEQFTIAIRLKPEMAALYRSRALARLDDGRPSPTTIEESLQDISEAIRLERPGTPEFALDRARRARLFLRAGRPIEALADAEAALRVVPDDADALLVRVKTLLELKRFDEVVGACDDALAKGKPSAELYELRGLARSSRQEYSGAIQDYTQSLALDPSRPTPLIQRGWAYLVSDATKLALSDFDQAIQIAPDDPDAYNGRGFARVLQGQHQLGVLDAEESLRRGGTDARTPYNAARVYARAVSAVVSEAPRRNLGQLQVADRYQERAQTLIREALERIPAEQRGEFWRNVVQTDPALVAIRQRPKFSQLAGQFDRKAK